MKTRGSGLLSKMSWYRSTLQSILIFKPVCFHLCLSGTPPPSFHSCSPVKPECQVYQGRCSSRDCVCVCVWETVCVWGELQLLLLLTKHHCDILLESNKGSQYYLKAIASLLAELSVWPFTVLRSKPVPLSEAPLSSLWLKLKDFSSVYLTYVM